MSAPEATRGKNILNSDEARKEFKGRLAAVTHYFRTIDDARDGLKDTIADLSTEFGLDKKLIRKIATTMYKQSYTTVHEENRHFEILYEMVIEGKLREAFVPLNENTEEDPE